ncbi:MAG TPA: prepilin-type N-terminal cleavage/methylation domain-containing protein [Candidatus Acidoferrales bacterium]|jgi:Tfp pilus assembly protein FimT|nr:prepilin-type N-terminal cleavage/methylation domain-containing protein [Candidatus Acidoferrales bacterium]
MTQAQENRQRSVSRLSRKNRGFTLVEVLMVVLIGIVLTAMAIPQVKSAIYNYRLNSAVAMSKWALQSTRFQALQSGYPFQVVFNATNLNYQIQSEPTGTTTYANFGAAVPLSAWPMTFSQNTTINFQPNGFVSATVGSNVFSIAYQTTTANITVSNYGNVSVSCTNGSLSSMC